MLASDRDEFLDRHDRAERVGHVRQGEQFRLRADQFLERGKVHFAALGDRNDFQRRARLFADHLPGNDVGVMFESRDQNLIARLHARADERLRNEVDGLRRTAHEDDLFRVTRIDESANHIASAFVGVRRALTQGVHATVDVGVVVFVIVADRLDHLAGALAGGGVVQIHERFAIDPLIEDGEVATDRFDVERIACRQGASAHALLLSPEKRSSRRCSR